MALSKENIPIFYLSAFWRYKVSKVRKWIQLASVGRVISFSSFIIHRAYVFLLNDLVKAQWISLSRFYLLFSQTVVSNSLQPHGLQHARLPCPSPSPRVCFKEDFIISINVRVSKAELSVQILWEEEECGRVVKKNKSDPLHLIQIFFSISLLVISLEHSSVQFSRSVVSH